MAHKHRCNKGGVNCHDEEHLCGIIIRTDRETIKKLVGNADHYCEKCGRAARSAENLCDPSRL